MKSNTTLLSIGLSFVVALISCKSRDSSLKTDNLPLTESEAKFEFSANDLHLKVKATCNAKDSACKATESKFDLKRALKSMKQDISDRLNSTMVSLSINGNQSSNNDDAIAQSIDDERKQLLAEKNNLEELLTTLETRIETLKKTPLRTASNLHLFSNASANFSALLAEFYHRRKPMVTAPGELWFWAGRGTQLFGSANRCEGFFPGSRLPSSSQLSRSHTKLEKQIVSRLKWSPDVALFVWASDVPPLKSAAKTPSKSNAVVAWTHGLYANEIAGRLQGATEAAGLLCVVKLLIPAAQKTPESASEN